MGRDIRMVPPDWEHPRYTKENSYRPEQVGRFIPMHDEDIETAANKWMDELDQWRKGEHEAQKGEHPTSSKYFWDYSGDPPSADSYRERKWTEAEATAYQIYENVSEGTPVSPVFKTEAEMKDWLVKQGHSEKAATEFIEHKYAPSMVFDSGQLKSGIDCYA